MSKSVVPQSSSNNGYPKGRLFLFAAILLVVVGGFYFSDQRVAKADQEISEDVTNRAVDINRFLKLQCERDDRRDQIIIGALEDAKRRAQRSVVNEFERAFEVGKIQFSIEQIRQQKGECQRTLPPVTKTDNS
jgi:hypothetical protein